MTNFPLRLEPEFKKELQELAKKDKRSLTKFIEKILEDYVDNEKANERSNQKRINVNIDDLWLVNLWMKYQKKPYSL